MGRIFKTFLEQTTEKSSKTRKVIKKGQAGSTPSRLEPIRHRLTNGSSTDQSESRKTIYACKYCEAHLALSSQLVSKNFQGKNGTAYLFESVVNVF